MAQLLAIKGLLEKTTPEFREALAAMASRLGLNPSYIAAIMGFETSYTFSPSIQNPYSHATGLIQFMPGTAQALGTSIDELKAMSAIEQLSYVEAYLQPLAARIQQTDRPVDYYLSVFYPAYIGRSFNDAIFAKGTVGYSQNQGLDADGDGKIVIGDLARKFQDVLDDALRRPPIPLAVLPTPESPC